ncbi:hypothetical protein ACFE04_018790 [Oxalis oulophora]
MEINMKQKSLINELTQGKELANQLIKHLNTTSSSNQTRQFLVDKILSTYEKSLSLITNKSTTTAAFIADQVPITTKRKITSVNDNSSPRSGSTDQENSSKYCHNDLYKKRRTMPRWTEHVQVCIGSGLEGSLDDGYSWRKYGQKDILGTNFPRGYYRCTHRHSQGCLATKQVQRTDEDPSILEVTYRGSHNCSTPLKSESPSTVINSDSNIIESQQNKSQQSFIRLETEEKVENCSSFTFPCAATKATEPDNNGEIFISDLILDQDVFTMSTPEENTEFDNCFLMSSFFANNLNGLSSESDYNGDTFSAPTSVTNSPIGDLDFSMIKVEFDPNFPFDNLEFFT